MSQTSKGRGAKVEPLRFRAVAGNGPLRGASSPFPLTPAEVGFLNGGRPFNLGGGMGSNCPRGRQPNIRDDQVESPTVACGPDQRLPIGTRAPGGLGAGFQGDKPRALTRRVGVVSVASRRDELSAPLPMAALGGELPPLLPWTDDPRCPEVVIVRRTALRPVGIAFSQPSSQSLHSKYWPRGERTSALMLPTDAHQKSKWTFTKALSGSPIKAPAALAATK